MQKLIVKMTHNLIQLHLLPFSGAGLLGGKVE